MYKCIRHTRLGERVVISTDINIIFNIKIQSLPRSLITSVSPVPITISDRLERRHSIVVFDDGAIGCRRPPWTIKTEHVEGKTRRFVEDFLRVDIEVDIEIDRGVTKLTNVSVGEDRVDVERRLFATTILTIDDADNDEEEYE